MPKSKDGRPNTYITCNKTPPPYRNSACEPTYGSYATLMPVKHSAHFEVTLEPSERLGLCISARRILSHLNLSSHISHFRFPPLHQQVTQRSMTDQVACPPPDATLDVATVCRPNSLPISNLTTQDNKYLHSSPCSASVLQYRT